ncbi:MAG: hypothetical protein KJP17_08925 [Gammaproteobacteria bacterium]|nr:hypothetical protein [Gammaproteobacteria bacterium]
MKRTHSITIVVTALAMIFPGLVIAQDDPAPLYVSVDCMKSSAWNYEQFERETWLPVHQYLVSKGKRNSWALYRVVFGDRSRCDYYVVTTYRGAQQIDVPGEYEQAFAAVHPDMDIAQVSRQTMAAREQVSSELWEQVDQTELRPHRYAVINRMMADDPVAYQGMESRVFKAGHQVLVDEGHRAGWAVYALISPFGSSIPYNYGTVDFVNDLGPVPMAEAMLAGNPDRDLDAMHEMLELRDHVLAETWALVAATDAPAKDSEPDPVQ